MKLELHLIHFASLFLANGIWYLKVWINFVAYNTIWWVRHFFKEKWWRQIQLQIH